MLQTARRDYPGFKTVEEKTKRSNRDFANINMAFIKEYVEKKGNRDQNEHLEFITKRHIGEDGEYCEAQPFFKIKEWFLASFPELKAERKAYREKVLEIYKNAAPATEEAKKDAENQTEEPAVAPIAAE